MIPPYQTYCPHCRMPLMTQVEPGKRTKCRRDKCGKSFITKRMAKPSFTQWKSMEARL